MGWEGELVEGLRYMFRDGRISKKAFQDLFDPSGA